MKINGINLSDKEYKIIEQLRLTGKYLIDNAQNKTIKNLISKGLCDFNSEYNGLILTKEGEKLEL